MANYANLKATIDAQIKANGNQQITGPILNAVLTAMINTIGNGYALQGSVAQPGDNPGAPDNPVAYLAAGPGTYTNFGGTVIPDNGHAYLLTWDTSWTAVQLPLPTFDLANNKQNALTFDATPTPGSSNPVTSDGIYKEIQKTPIIGPQINPADLTIADENENIIAEFVRGHIKTKKFDSSKTVETNPGEENVDLAIVDQSENELVRFAGGDMKTKNFDSKDITAPLRGKTYSILGDSISTFQGYLRSDRPGYDGSSYAYWYPKTYLNNVDKTWWRRMEKLTGLTLLQNCAWSGSQVCGNSLSTSSAQAGWSTRRITDLNKDGLAPDIIIAFIGVNDLRNADSRALGDWTGNSEIVAESSNVNTFSDAYSLMVSKLLTAYPYSELYCCTILDTGHSGWDTHDNAKYPCMNDRGNTTKEWNDTIRMVCESLGAKVINMHECGINFFNLDTYTGDRLHPNEQGALLMAKQVAKDLIAQSKYTIK